MFFFSTKFRFNRSLLKIKQYALVEKYFFSFKKKRHGPRQGVAQGRVLSTNNTLLKFFFFFSLGNFTPMTLKLISIFVHFEI